MPTRVLVAATIILCASATSSQPLDSEIDRALVHPDFSWRSIAADGVRVYYQPATFAERHRIMLLRSAQGALLAGLAFLDLEPDDRELRVLYVDDRAQMEQLIGRPYNGYANWTGQGVFLVCHEGWRSFDTHEIAHILTLGRWGRPIDGSAWLIEGVPMAVDGWCQTSDIDRVAGYLVGTGRWPGIAAFTVEHAALGEVPAGIFAASLLRYLRERFGAAVIEEIWRSGLAAALVTRGLEPAQIETDWLESLRDLVDPSTDAEWRALDAEGCG